jgi:hypothetical protein
MMRAVVVAICACLAISNRAAEERIWIDAKVNGAPAKIFVDTGATEFYLFRPAAERIGLRLPETKDESPWRMYFAKDKCSVDLPGLRKNVRPVIVEPPSYIAVGEADGFVGWKFLHNTVLQFDAARGRVIALPDSVGEMPGWVRLKVHKMKPLAVELTDHRIVIIDTGQSGGVALPAELWRQWKQAHPRQPIKRVRLATPSVGVVEVEESWADEIEVGPIHLTNVPVQETEPWSRGMAGDRHAATFGLAALKRLELIVDGKRGFAFVQAKR